MTASLTVDMDNAAFFDASGRRRPELARILRDLADKYEGNPERVNDIDGYAAIDWSGNCVGRLTITEA